MIFLKRVNPKDINKLQLEGLVKAGAFDSMNKIENHYLNLFLILSLNQRIFLKINLQIKLIYLVKIKMKLMILFLR